MSSSTSGPAIAPDENISPASQDVQHRPEHCPGDIVDHNIHNVLAQDFGQVRRPINNLIRPNSPDIGHFCGRGDAR